MKKYKSIVERCSSHKPKNMNYTAFHIWAEEKTKKGEKQTQCKKCKQWLFKEEI